MNNTRFLKIIIVVVLALLIPLLSYTIYQFLESDKNEELLTSIYERQLESILFSVNQDCWDRYGSWAADLSAQIKTNAMNHDLQQLSGILGSSIKNNFSIIGAFARFSQNESAVFWKEPYSDQLNNFNSALSGLLQNNKEEVDRMVRRAIEGYVRPVSLQWENGKFECPVLLFPIIDPSLKYQDITLAGTFLDTEAFIQEVVARKFSEMNDGNFAFAVHDTRSDKMIYTTEETPMGQFEKSNRLWLLDFLTLQVKLSGPTLRELANIRNRTNLIFLVVMNIVLIAGIFYLIRNVYYEMKLAEMKTDFVANVSHELRTPLSLIRMYAETLEMDRITTDEKRKQYYHTIMSETSRLSQLINNILDFSKINSNKKEYNFAWLDLSDIVLEVIEMYRFQLDRNGFQLDLDIDKNTPYIKGDAESIKQAFVNLLDNAIKYSADTRYIQVGLHNNQKQVKLWVQDKGIGIPESEHKKILEKFYRVGSSLVHNTKGSGLGLSLVNHIVNIHNGHIKIQSTPGKGSKFTLIFPNTNETE